jgi:phytol kinase
LHGEIARKFVHIVTGLFISIWAFYMTVGQIQILSILLLAGVIFSKYFNVFKSVHGVKRRTSGEIFFALSIGVIASIAPNPWVFAAAMLNMSLADGLAAIVGSSHGKGTTYKVFGHKKSLIGSITFYITSLLIIFIIADFSPLNTVENIWIAMFWVPLLATAVENLAYNGVDNLLVPLVVVATLDLINRIAI